MNLHQRILEARKSAGLTQLDIATHLGISRPAVAQWEQEDGTEPTSDRLRKFAALCKVNLLWLLTGTESVHIESGDVLPEDPDPDARPVKSDPRPGMMQIDELDLRAGMSLGGQVDPHGSTHDGEHVKSTWSIPEELVRQITSAAPERIKIITVVGESNRPMFLPGERIMVDTSDRVPSPAGFFALWDGYGEIVKRLEIIYGSKPNRVMVKSANPDYDSRELPLSELIINGRVLGKWQWS